MSKTDTGGQAYPQLIMNSSGTTYTTEGMSLLDYFAASATDNDMIDCSADRSFVATPDDLKGNRVRARYDFATAMVAEKRRRESE